MITAAEVHAAASLLGKLDQAKAILSSARVSPSTALHLSVPKTGEELQVLGDLREVILTTLIERLEARLSDLRVKIP